MEPGNLDDFLTASAARHSHLCPRQVLGVRTAIAAAAHYKLEIPLQEKRLLVILETDGYFADGVAVVMGASVGHRTLRVEDYGKIAATFADLITGEAIRIFPQVGVRQRAVQAVPRQPDPYEAMLQAYKVMPDCDLLSFQEVALDPSLTEIISIPEVRAVCARCGEEIFNQREEISGDLVLCKACAGNRYYRMTGSPSFH